MKGKRIRSPRVRFWQSCVIRRAKFARRLTEWLLQHRYMQIEAMTELTPLAIDTMPAKLPPQAA